MKIAFAEGNPKLFLAMTTLDPSFAIAEGSAVPGDNAMVIGSSEAKMMREEKLFSKTGDALKDFFGIPLMDVGGVLKPTNTVLDAFHLITPATWNVLQGQGRVTMIDDRGVLKMFYSGPVSGMPEKVRNAMQNSALTPLVKDGKSYSPVFVGSTEATMMKDKKLFAKEGDTIDGFFGNAVYVAGVLPQTGTALDLFHIVPEGMNIAL